MIRFKGLEKVPVSEPEPDPYVAKPITELVKGIYEVVKVKDG